jgi:hypothetical protein
MNHTHEDELACSHCDSTSQYYEVTLCTECGENAICTDCATDIQRELEVCSDECALKAIARLRRVGDRLFTRSLEHDRKEARRETARFEALDAELSASLKEVA